MNRRCRTSQVLFPLVCIIIALLSTGSCETIRDVVEVMQKPQVRVDSVELEALSFSGLTLQFDMAIENPNPIGISLAGFDYELEIEENSFVSGEASEGIAIEARGRSVVPLPIELSFKEIVGAIGTLKEKDEAAYRLSSGFTFDLPVLGRVRIPVSKAGTFPVLRLPGLKVLSLRLEELSLAGAELALDLEMTNSNGFKIFIQSLEYRLQVDGREWASGMRRQRVRVSENGSSIITIPVQLDFEAIGGGVYQMILTGRRIQYNFQASVDVGTSLRTLQSAVLPFDLSGQLGIQR